MRSDRARTRGGRGGAVAAVVWGLAEPLDRRLFRSDFSDIALLGKAVTRGRGWRAAGFALHAGNGALFGLLFHGVRRRTRLEPRTLGVVLAQLENVVLYSLALLVDRRHPARGEPGVPPLLTGRVFAQEAARHALFGLVLGQLVRSGDGADGSEASR